jgi:predicted nucleic acid-binding protein
MIEPLFVDTGGWIALFYAGDHLHQRAHEVLNEARRQKRPLLTTSAVLLETLDGFAQHNLRYLSAALRQTVQSSRALEVVTIEAALFTRGWDLYEARGD